MGPFYERSNIGLSEGKIALPQGVVLAATLSMSLGS